MKAALMREYHRPLELVERPNARVAHRADVVVRIGGAGVCATDLHAIEGLMEHIGVRLPRVLGHENAGWVEEVGDGVTTARRAMRCSCTRSTAAASASPAGGQRHALRPSRVHGPDGRRRLRRLRGRVRALAPAPARGVEPAAVAPHADAGLTAYHAVRRIAHLAMPGSTAAVIGVGGVGHIALQLLRELGSSATIAIDTDARRRALAAELGAGEVIEGTGSVDAVRELTGGRGADLVLDFVGTDQAHADSLAMLARGGTYSVHRLRRDGRGAVGPARRQRALRGREPRRQLDRPLRAARSRTRPAGIVLKTETHPLDAVNDVLARLREGEVTGRAVLVP